MAEVVEFTVEGLEDLGARLERVADGIQDLSGAFDEIGHFLVGFFSGEVFASRGQVIGEPWPALSDAYAAEKAREFPGAPPLIRSGLMNRGFREESRDQSVLIYNTQEYFDRHQLGDGVPQRIVMKIDDTRQNKIVSIVEDDVERKVSRA